MNREWRYLVVGRRFAVFHEWDLGTVPRVSYDGVAILVFKPYKALHHQHN